MNKTRHTMQKRRVNRSRQGGWTLQDVLVAIVIVGFLTYIFMPNIAGIFTSSVAPKAAEIVGNFINQTKVQMVGAGATPYTNYTTAHFANAVRGENAFEVTGSGAAATVTHKLGSSGAAVAVAPGTITTAGDSLQFTFSNVEKDACASLASSVSHFSAAVSVNGTSVRSTTGGVTTKLDSAALGLACTADTNNTVVFTAR